MNYRRLRSNEAIRSLIRETRIFVEDLIYPLFVVEGVGIKEEITSMPDNYHFSLDKLLEEVRELLDIGVKAVLLFGIPDFKDEMGTSAYCDGNIVARAIKAIKGKFPDMYVIGDVCLCEYTSHGHCGVIEDGCVENEKTLPLLAKIAISYSEAGVDMVAPSDMMDGRIKFIRQSLDKEGYNNVSIIAYSAKYCSSFYGPFREAAHSAPQFGDRRGYQMDPANSREAIKEIIADINEGADIVIIKPAMPYLDIVAKSRETLNVPICAYQVSGEYAMIKAGQQMGWIDGKKVAMESLISIKRAGADMIITYFAKAFAKGEL